MARPCCAPQTAHPIPTSQLSTAHRLLPTSSGASTTANRGCLDPTIPHNHPPMTVGAVGVGAGNGHRRFTRPAPHHDGSNCLPPERRRTNGRSGAALEARPTLSALGRRFRQTVNVGLRCGPNRNRVRHIFLRERMKMSQTLLDGSAPKGHDAQAAVAPPHSRMKKGRHDVERIQLRASGTSDRLHELSRRARHASDQDRNRQASGSRRPAC
jgi:hypothetical protein